MLITQYFQQMKDHYCPVDFEDEIQEPKTTVQNVPSSMSGYLVVDR